MTLLEYYALLSAGLFAVGAAGVLILDRLARRQAPAVAKDRPPAE